MKSLLVLILASVTIVVASCIESTGRSSENSSFEQAMEAALSRGTQPAGVVTRRLSKNDETGWNSAGLSHDGRYMAYVRVFEDGDVAIRDLETWETRQVTFDGTAWENWALASVFSTSGDRIAYIWYEEYEHQLYFKVVNTDGSNPRTLLHVPDDAGTFFLYDWAPDDESLLVLMATKRANGDDPNASGRLVRLMALPVDGSDAKVVKAFEQNDAVPKEAFYSPDGRFIAYTGQADPSGGDTDVYMLNVEKGTSERIFGGSTPERVVGWNRAGTKVFVSSFEEGNPSLWAIPVTAGAISGNPILIRRDMHGAAVGQVAADKFYYWVMAQTPRLHTVTIDLESGRVMEGPTEEPNSSYGDFAWSPDGHYLAYINRGVTVVRSADGTHKQEFALPDGYGRGRRHLRWSQDSSELSFHVRGTDGMTRMVLNMQTGEYADDGPVSLYSGAVTRDGRYGFGVTPDGITRYDRQENSKTVIYEPRTDEDRLCWDGTMDLRESQDASVLVIGSTSSMERGPFCLGIYSFGDGNLRWIYLEDQDPQEWPLVSFTASGDHILFTLPGSDENFEAWMIPIDGTDAKPKRLFSYEGLGPVDLHPDGKTLAFKGGRTAVEFWVMDGLDSVVAE